MLLLPLLLLLEGLFGDQEKPTRDSQELYIIHVRLSRMIESASCLEQAKVRPVVASCDDSNIKSAASVLFESFRMAL